MITIKIMGIEIIQSIQNLNNKMPLVQDKLTYIRFYLSSDKDEILKINAAMKVSIIDAQKNTHELTTVYNIQPAFLTHENKSDDIHARRLCWDKSLNFKLPQNFLTTHKKNSNDLLSVKFELDKTQIKSINDKQSLGKINLVHSDPKKPLEIIGEFHRVDVNLRVVAYRYTDVQTGEIHEPSHGEINVIKDYVESAFPISKLNFSTITIDAPREFIQPIEVLQRSERTDEHLDKVYTFLFLHLLAIRYQDISFSPIHTQPHNNDKAATQADPWEPNTLYLGVLSDPGSQIVGSAMDSPGFVTPHVVAFCGAVSYGELGAHELAHMLGELHPGIPDQDIHGNYLGQKNQIDSNARAKQRVISNNIDPLGRISNSQGTNNAIVGLDSQIKSSMPILLSGNEYYDLMTYRYPKWLSAYTYEGLFLQLSALSNLKNEPAETGEYYWNIVGDYNLVNKTAKIHYMLKSEYPLEKPKIQSRSEPGESSASDTDALAEKFDLQIQYARQDPGDTSGRHDYKLNEPEEIYLRRSLSKSDNSKFVGVFQHTLRTNDYWPPKCLTLSINGNKVDVFDPGNESGLVKKLVQELIDLNTARQNDSPSSMTKPSDNSDQHKDNIQLKYSVDKGGFYLSFDWLNLSKMHDSDPGKTSTVDIGDLFYKTIFYELPIITTIQMKANWNKKSAMMPAASSRWQTVAVTSRLQEEYWISPDFTLALSSHDEGEKLLPPYNTRRENINEFRKSFKHLGIRFRVCITLMGEGLVIFDSEKYDPIKNISNNPGVSIECFGSKGLDQTNFYHPYTIDCCKNSRATADEENDKHSRLFYRADV